MLRLVALVVLALLTGSVAAADVRQKVLLSDAPWQFLGAGSQTALPAIGSAEFANAPWKTVQVPHVFQTREHMSDPIRALYRRDFTIPRDFADKQAYIVFEGAATVADVYMNGQHLGQHRGAYTRFVFDATTALKPGRNEVAVRVDNDTKNISDCLPDGNRLYKVWGGLYRKVWLVAVDPLHIDPTDYASPGVYITPQEVTAASADLSVRALIRNASTSGQKGTVRAVLLDPSGRAIKTWKSDIDLTAGQRTDVEFKDTIARPKLWSPDAPNLYQVRVEVLRGGKVVDEVVQPTGFRKLAFDTATGRVTLNDKPIVLAGGNLHQEIESKASAMTDDDFRFNYALIKDLGFNFIRLAHYPHAQLEYDLCDRLGLLCWAENGHTNTDKPTTTADQITTEMVKQNYNHPSICVWSIGNEAGQEVADREVPVVKALDTTRPVAVANMRSDKADFKGINAYPGWYGGEIWSFTKKGYVSETGAGGVVTTHCDYAAASYKVDSYEPEEYQQLVAESRFQTCIRENDGSLGMFAWWNTRDFNDTKYKKPVGWNTKGLVTYAGFKKDVYYLYRCFLRPTEPTVHITSKLYYIRTGAMDNGIKAYSNAPKLTLTLNGRVVSTVENGKYSHKNGRRVDNVFYWHVALHTGKNLIGVTDGAGHSDSAVIYFYGTNGLPEIPVADPLVTELKTSNPSNPAYFVDMPVQAQWPIYYDLDSTADNSFDALPRVIQGAKCIATRRLTKPGQETDLSFKLTRPATVFVMATSDGSAPSFVLRAGFKEVPAQGLVWRNNDLMLVPAQLYSRKAAAGETVRIPQPDRDQVVLLKE